MRSIQWVTLALMLISGAATGQATSMAAPPQDVKGGSALLPADASTDNVLDALDQRGKTLKDFAAKVALTKIDPNLGNSKTRTGQVWLQKISDDDARLRVVFDKVNDGRITQNDKQEYLLDNGWLTDRDYRISSEVKRQVLKPGQKMNLMKLGDGPFPLPIGQDKADVHRMFDVSMEKPAADDPANSLHLVLSPKPESRLARRFKQIDVYVDRVSHMPVRVDTIDPRGSDQEQTELKDVRVNSPGGLKDSDFQLPAINQQKWSLRTEPYAD